MRNFLGHDGFIWWVGIVEDIQDPLNLGRCKVRCFGYHPEKSTDLVPTEDLPWATSIHPTNTSNLYASLKLGDWVFGFFLDALSAQEPAILGYFPTVPDTTEKYFSDELITTRNFNRVNTANNSANTVCWEIGNNIVEIVTQSLTEANGHILIQHKTGAKVNIDSDGKILIYAPNNSISIQAPNGDINLDAVNINLTATESINSNAKNISLNATETVTSVSGLATTITAGGLISFTAAGAITSTAGAYMSMTSIGYMTAKTIAGILNIESASTLNIGAGSVLNATAVGSLTAQAPVLTITDGGSSWTPSGITADQARQDADIQVAYTLPSDGFAKGVAASVIFGS
jgi:hypothetical protein